MSRSRGKHDQPRQPVVADTPPGDYIGESDRQMPGPRPYNSPIPGGAPTHLVSQPSVRQTAPVAEPKPEFRGMLAHGVPPEAHTTEEHARHERGPNAVKVIRPHYGQYDQAPPPVPVYLVKKASGAQDLRTQAGDRFTVPVSGVESIRIAGRDRDRTFLAVLVESASGGSLVTSPSVPATTVAKQNPNNFPVQVVIGANGATITAVVVGGTTVGTAAGTYYVPAFSAISISYTVATPTWVWSDPTGAGATGVRLDHEVGNLDVGFGNLVKPSASNYLMLPSQDEVFAVSADTYTCILSVLFLYDAPAAGG